MDASQFDHLSRAIAASGTRRALTRVLATLPLVGTLGLLVEGAEGKRQQKKRRQGPDARSGSSRSARRCPGRKRRRASPGLPERPTDSGAQEQEEKTAQAGCNRRPVSTDHLHGRSSCHDLLRRVRSVVNDCGTAVDCGTCARDRCATRCLVCAGRTLNLRSDAGASCRSPGQVGEVSEDWVGRHLPTGDLTLRCQ